MTPLTHQLKTNDITPQGGPLIAVSRSAGRTAIMIDSLKKTATIGFETSHIDETFVCLDYETDAKGASVLSDSERREQIELLNTTLGNCDVTSQEYYPTD